MSTIITLILLFRALEIFLKYKKDLTSLTAQTQDSILTLMMDRVETNPNLSEDFQQMLKTLMKFGAITPRMAKEPVRHCKNQTPLHFAVKYATKAEVEALGINQDLRIQKRVLL